MSNTYQAGDRTKEKILQVSRALFYSKGFEETTYDDISKKAEINRALIPYHFKNKKTLGAVIHKEFLANIADIKNELLKDNDEVIATAVSSFLYYYTLYNENVARFIYQIQKEHSFREMFLSSEKVFITGLFNKAQKIDSETLDILTHMDYGIEKEIVEMMYVGSYKSKLNEIVCMEIHMMLRYLGYSKKDVQDILDKAMEITEGYKLTVKDEFEVKFARKRKKVAK